MLGKVAAGLAGLGLIGGAGTVVYNNHGDTTVKIKNDKTGRVQSVRIEAGSRCPAGIETGRSCQPSPIPAGQYNAPLTLYAGPDPALLSIIHGSGTSPIVRGDSGSTGGKLPGRQSAVTGRTNGRWLASSCCWPISTCFVTAAACTQI